MISFAHGQLVRYKDYSGFVNFISHQYITVCIKVNREDPMRCVNLVVPPEKWEDVLPIDLDDSR